MSNQLVDSIHKALVNRLNALYDKMKSDYENGQFASPYDIKEIKEISFALETVYQKEAKNERESRS